MPSCAWKAERWKGTSRERFALAAAEDKFLILESSVGNNSLGNGPEFGTAPTWYKNILVLTGIVWLPCRLVIADWASCCEPNLTKAQPAKEKDRLISNETFMVNNLNVYAPSSPCFPVPRHLCSTWDSWAFLQHWILNLKISKHSINANAIEWGGGRRRRGQLWLQLRSNGMCAEHLNKILSAIKKHFCKNRFVHSCMKINIDIGGCGPHQGFGISAHQRPLYKNNTRPALAATGWNVKFKLNRKIYKKFPLHLLAHYIVICVPAVGQKGAKRGDNNRAGGRAQLQWHNY